MAGDTDSIIIKHLLGTGTWVSNVLNVVINRTTKMALDRLRVLMSIILL